MPGFSAVSFIHIFQGEEVLKREPTLEKVIVKKPDNIVLRPYQQEAIDSCLDSLNSGTRSSLLVLATGLGKSILFSKLVMNWEGRVLILVHLDELLINAREEVGNVTGEDIGTEKAEQHWEGERICVAMVQSISTKLKRFRPSDFNLIIIDESHHSASPMYLRILEYFKDAKVIGLTATDQRADGKPLPFDVCSYRMGIKEGIDQGYLVPIKGERVTIDTIDLKRVRINKNGSFDEDELDMEMVKGAAAISDVIFEDWGMEKGILFFPGCASARLVCDFLNEKEEGLAVYIDGKIVGDERRELVSQLRNGESTWLCNVGIATEGFNWPEAAVVGMCCPTKSRPAYVQRAGRGTRPLQGLLNGLSTSASRREAIALSAKPEMTILDFTGVSSGLSLISHESVLSENPLQQARSVPGPKEKESSELELENLSQKQHPSYRGVATGISSLTTSTSEQFCPFDQTNEERDVVNVKGPGPENSDTISPKQHKIMARYGIDDWTIPKGKAGKMMGFIAQRGFRLSNSDKKLLRNIYNE